MTLFRSVFLAFGFLALAACEPTLRPDYEIYVTETAQGNVAAPPTCSSWTGPVADPFDNQPLPQFGCATARNLAFMSDEPKDLVEGRALGDARSVLAVGAIRRYDNNQPRTLILPAAETSTAGVSVGVSMTGDATGGGSSSGGSSKAP